MPSLKAKPDNEAAEPTKAETVNMTLEQSTPRQLGDEGLVVFWRDGQRARQREGLACILSVCPHPDCTCQLVYVDGFVVDGNATAVRWDQEGVHLDMSSGAGPAHATLDARMTAIVDPDSGETKAHPDLPDATDPVLVDWLASEMNGELLEVLHRYRARAKGYPPELKAADIDLDAVEGYHLVPFVDLVEGARSDDYLLSGRRYWAGLFICPYPDCDCHQVRIVFFDEAEETGDATGTLLLDIGRASGFGIEEMRADQGVPEHLIKDLWTLFKRRHDVGTVLRQREAQIKAIGETLWLPVRRPVRTTPKPGRNEPCPCGSGRKFKKCCLGRDGGASIAGGAARRPR